jgi:nucleoside-diphosphate-sugar epimerase
VSRFDEYGQTKVIAERLLVESGLPRWAWLRQTGILHPGMLEIRDPIMTHSPFAGDMEWVSAEDSASLLVAATSVDVPDEFWGGIYNIGGGEGWRLTNWELQTTLGTAMGVTDIRRWSDIQELRHAPSALGGLTGADPQDAACPDVSCVVARRAEKGSDHDVNDLIARDPPGRRRRR